MKHERTFGSLQTDGITSKNYFPPKKLEISFWWDFSKMPNRVEKKKITDCQRCSEATFSSLIVSFWEKEKKWPTIIHTRWTTRKVWRQKHTVMCVQFELKEESQHEKLGTYYLIAGSRKQPVWHPILFVEKKNHVLRLMLTNSRNEWPTYSFFSLLCTEKNIMWITY